MKMALRNKDKTVAASRLAASHLAAFDEAHKGLAAAVSLAEASAEEHDEMVSVHTEARDEALALADTHRQTADRLAALLGKA